MMCDHSFQSTCAACRPRVLTATGEPWHLAALNGTPGIPLQVTDSRLSRELFHLNADNSVVVADDLTLAEAQRVIAALVGVLQGLGST